MVEDTDLIKADLPAWERVLDLQPVILSWILEMISKKEGFFDLSIRIGLPKYFELGGQEIF